ncbi:hypothetical protein THAOC_03560 [Thalassiosira oceanica]|uniref:DDE Tnp4 domain-containing protein n=1 Tax=Thalassiosira oceanica TaxID=159749 RepID=K0TB80_THAOC|nr:hypothetical protein THAOC_03560 [Thalassiosira oceanica]|eukprot:EJK74740.1 hypothetical protein THAOC_03560 [Thalassiosira oceanica]
MGPSFPVHHGRSGLDSARSYRGDGPWNSRGLIGSANGVVATSSRRRVASRSRRGRRGAHRFVSSEQSRASRTSLTMPKVRRRRERTGAMRSGPINENSVYSRPMHLDANQVGFRWRLQREMIRAGEAARDYLAMLPFIASFTILVQNDVISLGAAMAATSLARLCQLKFHENYNLFLNLTRLDQQYHDIPFDEEAENRSTTPRMPRQHIRLNTWSEYECRRFTGFKRHELIRLYTCFDLVGQTSANGRIRVPNGGGHAGWDSPTLIYVTSYSEGRRPFGVTVFHGYSVTLTIDMRLSFAIKGLGRFASRFHYFYTQIERYCQRALDYYDINGTLTHINVGLIYLPFIIFGFIDCSVFRVYRPFSSTVNQFYAGSQRNPRYHDAQRAVYTGWKKFHGIKIETVMLPNGLSTVYGPVSARVFDTTGVAVMSGIDQFLQVLMQGWNITYYLFGDGVYNTSTLSRIRSYFRTYRRVDVLTRDQIVVNQRLKACRELIEHTYADLQNIFRLCPLPSNFKLGQSHPYAQSQLRLAKALDRGQGQNWQTLRFSFGMANRPREKRVESREWSCSPYARLSPTSPLSLGVDRSAHLQRDYSVDYSTLGASVGSAGTTTIGRVELLHGLPWWPDDGAHGTYLFIPNTSPMMCCGRMAIPMALRPPLSIKRAGATANLCIIARARPAEVSEPLITSLL